MISPDTIQYIVDVIVTVLFLLFGQRFQRDSEEWLESFIEWQEYERWRMSEIEGIYERLGEWQEIADRIDRGEHPYNNLTDALTQRFGKFAHGMVKHLESELTRLQTGEKLPEKKT